MLSLQHDASGRKGKGYGAYRFTEQYGDINDYSPIYDRTSFMLRDWDCPC